MTVVMLQCTTNEHDDRARETLWSCLTVPASAVYIHTREEEGSDAGGGEGDERLRLLRPAEDGSGRHAFLRPGIEGAPSARDPAPGPADGEPAGLGSSREARPGAGNGPDDAPQERPSPRTATARGGVAGPGLPTDGDPSHDRRARAAGAGVSRLETGTGSGAEEPAGLGLVTQPGSPRHRGAFLEMTGAHPLFRNTCAYAHVGHR